MKELFERLSFPDGTNVEVYSESDVLHRGDGPAWRMVTPQGLKVEMYFKAGKLERADGPAISVSHPDGAGADAYFRDGKRVDPPCFGQNLKRGPDLR